MIDDKLYRSLSANTIKAKLTNHVQRTRLITSSTDKNYSLDFEGDFRPFQNYPHPDDHTLRNTVYISFAKFYYIDCSELELNS